MGHPFRLASLALAGWLGAGVAQTLLAEESAQPFQEWQILEVKTSRPISFTDLLTDLATVDVIYIGEDTAIARILKPPCASCRRSSTATRSRRWAWRCRVGWAGRSGSLFGGTGHGARSVSPSSSLEGELGRRLQRLCAAHRLRPLPSLARARLEPAQAARAPGGERRTLQRLEGSGMLRWQMRDEVLSDEPAYREIIVSQLRACHSASPKKPTSACTRPPCFGTKAWPRRSPTISTDAHPVLDRWSVTLVAAISSTGCRFLTASSEGRTALFGNAPCTSCRMNPSDWTKSARSWPNRSRITSG